MSEFVKIMEQMNRMCKNDCGECGLSYNNNGTGFVCSKFLRDEPKKAEEIIMKWAKENPVQTNYDKLVEVFGDIFADVSYWDCNRLNCQKLGVSGVFCADCKYKGFWQKEYKGVIENE